MLHRVAITLAAITLADGQAPVSCTFKTPTGSSVRCAHARASFFSPLRAARGGEGGGATMTHAAASSQSVEPEQPGGQRGRHAAWQC
jgi:hypothetical protein